MCQHYENLTFTFCINTYNLSLLLNWVLLFVTIIKIFSFLNENLFSSYGELSPSTFPGKLIGKHISSLKFYQSESRHKWFLGGLCALCGIFILTLPIPIVVNSFASYYKNRLWRNEVNLESIYNVLFEQYQ